MEHNKPSLSFASSEDGNTSTKTTQSNEEDQRIALQQDFWNQSLKPKLPLYQIYNSEEDAGVLKVKNPQREEFKQVTQDRTDENEEVYTDKDDEEEAEEEEESEEIVEATITGTTNAAIEQDEQSLNHGIVESIASNGVTENRLKENAQNIFTSPASLSPGVSKGSDKKTTLKRKHYRYNLFTWANLRMIIRLAFGLGSLLGAVLVSSTDLWAGVPVWRWLAFMSIVGFSWDFNKLVIMGSVLYLLSRFLYNSSVVKNTHYYCNGLKIRMSLLLCTIIWIVSWVVLIGLAIPPNSYWLTANDYITRGFGVLILVVFLLTSATLGKEICETIFEQTTHFADVERMLKGEYFLWRLGSQGTVFPHDVVAGFVLAGSHATKADPKILRQCTRYLSKESMTCFDSYGDALHIKDIDEAADFGEILFNRLSDQETAFTLDFTEEIKSLRAKRESEQQKIIRAYGYMLRGRSHVFGESSTRNINMNRPSGSSFSGLEPKASPDFSTKARAKIKLDTVEKAYLGFGGTLPQYAPDPLYGWTHILDVAHRGHGSAKTFRAALIRFFQDRTNVAATLRDAHAAVERLGNVFTAVAWTLSIVFAALIFAGASSYEVWLGLTSFFVACAVIFGPSLSHVFENIIFLFFRHVFDVGDLIVIDNDYYSVRRLELMQTLLLKWSGQYILVENTWLAKQQVQNLTRSGLYWHALDTSVDIGTCTNEFVHGVRQNIKQYIQKHPDAFSGEYMVCMSNMNRPLHVVLSLWIEFSYVPNNLVRLFTDIGRAHEAMCVALRAMGATSSGVSRAAIHIGNVGPPPFISTSPDPGFSPMWPQSGSQPQFSKIQPANPPYLSAVGTSKIVSQTSVSSDIKSNKGNESKTVPEKSQ